MKPVFIYISHVFILVLLTIGFSLMVGSFYNESSWRIFLQIKPFLYADLVTCGVLFLFFLKSTLHSTGKIILICSICFVFTSIIGFVVYYLNVWYSNIPEVVVIYQQTGFLLTFVNISASFITCLVTVIILLIGKKPNVN